MRFFTPLLLTYTGYAAKVHTHIKAETGVSPVQKVVEMLKELRTEAEHDQALQEQEMTAYAEDCTNKKAMAKSKIEDLNTRIDTETANINSAIAAINARRLDLIEADTTLALNARDKKTFTGIRQREQTNFAETNFDYGEAITAAGKAIEVLKASQVQPTPALIQLNAKSTTGDVMKAVASFLQVAQSQPQAKEYVQGSALGGVIKMIEELKKKFEEAQREASVKNVAATNSFETLISSLAQQREDLNKEKVEYNKEISESKNKQSSATEAKAAFEAERDQTKKTSAETQNLCAQTNSVYASNNKVQLNEIEALTSAINIMAGKSVGNANDNLDHHIEETQTVDEALGTPAEEEMSFLQVRSKSNNGPRVVSFLAERSRKFNSRMLAALSLRVQASPFKKIMRMIRDMISKLQTQAKEEAEFHGWCQGKLKGTTIEKDAKKDEVDDNKANLEQNQAKKQQLETDIADDKETIKMTQEMLDGGAAKRAENYAENTRVIKESQEGQAAVIEAIAVLKEFYENASSAGASAGGANPDTQQDVYGGAQAKGANIINIMEVINSEFQQTEVNTKATETKESQIWTDLKNNGEVDLAAKKATVKHNEERLADVSAEVNRLTALLNENQELLKELVDLLAGYQAQCKPQVSYEERVEMRENEIQSLKEAKDLLQATPVADTGAPASLDGE